MDKVIARATDSINQLLKSSPEWRLSEINSRLVDTLNLLNQLLEPDSPRNDWTRLFCRQLNRLMEYNALLPREFWAERHDDILCVLKGSNGGQDKSNSWKRFLERMKLEGKLEQHELQFQQTFGKRKSLSELVCEHQEFLKEYLEKCISLHSKLHVPGLVENMDDLLCRVYGLTKVSLTSESQICLKEKLKCIEMSFDCANRSLGYFGSRFSTYDDWYNGVNNSHSGFLPSVGQIEINTNYIFETIRNALRRSRWFVILGDPGSAKTTLLRWITRIFAETARSSHEEVVLEEEAGGIPVRIPILIRIGEFAKWLEQNQRKTLMDYIGKHTWLSKPYTHDDSGYVLKESIDHGHALILLDGLDEITEVGRRGEIVDLVRNFIDKYVHAPDFFSAFDDTVFNTRELFNYRKVVQMQPPSKSGGNQIIVTSRTIGYQFYPLVGPCIHHYSLLLMDHEEAKTFVKNWMTQVDKDVLDLLLNEGITLGEETVKNVSKRRYNAVEKMFKNGSELLLSNPSLLSLICTFIFQSPDEFIPESRVEVYNHAVQAALGSWRRQAPGISESILTNFLIDLATYLHLQSPSGLIDGFDTESLCLLTLHQQSVSNDRNTLCDYANELISLLQSNIGIVAERGLQVFGFLHLSFQEYFAAQALVRRSSIEEVAKRILSFTSNPRFRESLHLALDWISWKWSFDDYNKFCNLLVSPTEKYAIPFGTLLFFDAINYVQRLPTNTAIFIALNTLLDHPSNVIRNAYLISNLTKLHKDIIIEWMQLHLKDDKQLFKFCECFPMRHNRFLDMTEIARKSISSVIYQQMWSFHHRSSSAEFIIDQTLRRTMASIDISDQIFNKDLSLCLISHNICISKIHPLIISIVIAVCGGLCFKSEGRALKIQFSPEQMHRESSVLVPIVEYFDNNEESHSIKIQTLIKQYESVLQQSLPSDTSLDIVDTFIILICLQGVSQPLMYQKYNGYQALPRALERFKWTWFYFKQSCELLQSSSDTSFIKSEIESIMNVVFSQPNQTDG